jgi:ABC-type uncharacterized transport system permease subunit
MSFVLAVPAAAFYLWAAWRQWQTFCGKKTANRSVLLIATMVGALLHLGYIASHTFGHEHINFEVFEVGSLISWVIVLLLIFSSQRKPVDNLFIGLLPMAAVILLITAMSNRYVPLTDLSYGLTWHILLSILAYSILTIAAVQAVLLYLQDKALKNRQTQGFIQALPPLQLMDKLLFEMLWLGMILLTASYIVGWPYILDLKGQHLGHKIVFALISWLIFAWLLFGRYRFGWRGAIASRWTLIGTGFMILSYFGSKIVLELLGRV